MKTRNEVKTDRGKLIFTPNHKGYKIMISQDDKKARIKKELQGFWGGTSAYYRWSPLMPDFLLTDGAKYGVFLNKST